MKSLIDYIAKSKNIYVLFLFAYAAYCALIVGQSWDEGFHINQGKVVLNYLLSLGKNDEQIIYRENYSSIYWSISYLLTKIFPIKYEIQVSHLINLSVSIFTIFGICKLCREIFNKEVGRISFLILFFYPIFFGHMAFNSKDTILAACNIWIFYLFVRYIKNQNIKVKIPTYIYSISLLAAIGTGIQLVFLGSLIPILFFLLLDIFYLKIFTKNTFKYKKFFIDILKCFLLFYFVLIFFWIDAHTSILIQPYKSLVATLSDSYWTGWPTTLINGNYFYSSAVPKAYFFTNIVYKTPEYILLLYLLFFFLLIKNTKFLKSEFKYFNAKIFLVFLILLYPNMIIFFIPYPLYDGLRLFIWVIPYFVIIPALSIYYLLKNYKNKINKYLISFFVFLFFYFLSSFILLTPYQYTYLNILAGKKELLFKRFENDYWSASLNELIKNTDFKKNKTILVASCGVNNGLLKKYMSKKYNNNFRLVGDKEAEFVIMTNRSIINNKKITNCFEKYKGKDVFNVSRGKIILSSVRKL